MKFQQIRSATVKITYAGRTFLIDPWLAPRYMAGCLGIVPIIAGVNRRGDKRKAPIIAECSTWEAVNLKHKWTMCPRTPLPFSIGKINADVDAYICTHAHMDHIGLGPNGKGCEGLKKNVPIYAINRRDADFLEFSGMQDVRVIEDPVYLCGDTVWCSDVQETIAKYQPDVIITNNCAAMLKANGRLIMDVDDLANVIAAAPNAFIIASHMDAVPHATLTRKTLAKGLKKRGLLEKVHIPADGETYEL